MKLAKGSSSPSRFIQTLIIGFTVFVISILTLLWWVGFSLQEKHAPLVYASSDMKFHLGEFHLWFEESIQNDQSLTKKDVWENLTSARWNANALLNGGTNEHVSITPLESIQARNTITKVLLLLDQLEKLAETRLIHNSQAGSADDQIFDSLYKQVIVEATNLEKIINKKITKKLANYNNIAVILGIIALFLSYTVNTLCHRFERRRFQQENSLAQSEEYLRLLLNSAGEGAYGMDIDGKITFINTQAMKLTGYSDVASLIGKYGHQTFHHSRENGTPFPIEECKINLSFQKGAGITVDDEHFFRKDGSSFPVEYHSHPILNPTSQLVVQ
jgi:PAS domain S-box-containing protein